MKYSQTIYSTCIVEITEWLIQPNQTIERLTIPVVPAVETEFQWPECHTDSIALGVISRTHNGYATVTSSTA